MKTWFRRNAQIIDILLALTIIAFLGFFLITRVAFCKTILIVTCIVRILWEAFKFDKLFPNVKFKPTIQLVLSFGVLIVVLLFL